MNYGVVTEEQYVEFFERVQHKRSNKEDKGHYKEWYKVFDDHLQKRFSGRTRAWIETADGDDRMATVAHELDDEPNFLQTLRLRQDHS